jgi:uncharacterized protein DUF5667
MGAGRFTARSGDSSSQVEDELTARLRALPLSPSPDSRFLNDLRAQLVSIAPRIIAESADGPAPAREPAGAGFLASLRRPLLAFAGAAAVLVLLLGLAVWVAGGALPGQSLYGVKRASENFQLSVAGGDAGRGKAYLQQSTNRAKEASKLGSDHTSLLLSTLGNADTDGRMGMQLLGQAAVSQKSAEPLSGIANWAAAQQGRLTGLRDRLPAGAAKTRSQASLIMVQRIATRAAQLKGEIGCGCLSRTKADELGPEPCTSCPAGTQPGLPSLPVNPGSPLPSVSLPSLGGTASPTPS